MNIRICACAGLVLLLWLPTTVSAADGEELAGLPVIRSIPASPAEFILAARDEPSLMRIAPHGGSIYSGFAQIFAEDMPVGPAPHTPWARPLPGKRLKVLVVNELHANHDVAELVRALDVDYRHAFVPFMYHFPRSNPEFFAEDAYFPARARQALADGADVIVAPTVSRLLGEQFSQQVFQKVKAGAGLVLIGGGRFGGGGQYRFWTFEKDTPEAWRELDLVDTIKGRFQHSPEPSVSQDAKLFADVPFSMLPGHHLFDLDLAEGSEVLASDGKLPLVVTGRVGKGRVVLLPWAHWWGPFPVEEKNRKPEILPYQEYYAAAVAKAILYAANRGSLAGVRVATKTIEAGKPSSVPMQIEPVPALAQVWMRLRHPRGHELWSKTTSIGSGTLAAELPAVAAGRYLLDVIVRDMNGASLGWGSYVLDATGKGALAVELDKPAYGKGEPVKVTAKVSGVPAGKLTARLQVTDTHRRLLLDQSQPVQDGAATFAFPNRQPLAVLEYADVTVLRDGQPVLADRVDIFVPDFTWPNFTNLLWPGGGPEYVLDRRYRRQREIGFGMILGGGYGGTHSAANHMIAASGARPCFTNVVPVHPINVEKHPVQERERTLKDVARVCEQLNQIGSTVIYFQDERHGQGDSGEPTEEALAEFRKWLPSRYDDIATLNKAWGSEFASFDDVVPALTKDWNAREHDSLAPWLQWRLWALDEVIKIDRAAAAMIRDRVTKDAYMGLEGIFGLGGHNIPYGGTDLWEQSKDCFNTAAPYGENLINGARSFYDGPIMSWSGYGRDYSQYERYIWGMTLQGHWSLGWWYGPCFYHPWDCWYQQATWVNTMTRPLREGVGDLLLANRPIISEPIAFLYSQPSLYAMGVLGQEVNPNNPNLLVRPAQWARISLQRMLQDQGVQFGFVSEEQMQKGQHGGTKLLILSSCVAIDPETAKAVRTFVEQGGIVLADLSPGVFDDHGAPQSPGLLDDLFGIKHTARFHLKTDIAEWGVGTHDAPPELPIGGQWYIGQYYEDTLRVTDGRAIGKHYFDPDGVPAFVYKKTGKGSALLMNYLETEYRRVPDNFQKVLARELLHAAGIEAPFTLYDARTNVVIDDGLKVSRWRDGGAHYIGILLDKGRRVRVELHEGGHVYELARRLNFRRTDVAEVDMRDRPYALLAVMPYRIGALQVELGAARRGQPLGVNIALPDIKQPVRHVVHLEVRQPDGSVNLPLTQNVLLENGRWQGTLPLALNDPTGTWAITAKEAVSGVTAEAKVEVKP